ncbi:MAG: 50S ribosomal protein L17 [Vulcanimicrobiota bacterium]
MRHKKKNRRFGRTSGHRQSMMKNLVTSLFKNKRIHTTEAKAKEVRQLAEKMITLAKKGDLAAKRQVFRYVSDRDVARDLFDVIGPQYSEGEDREERKGGFTRIIKTENRKGDNAPMVILELV